MFFRSQAPSLRYNIKFGALVVVTFNVTYLLDTLLIIGTLTFKKTMSVLDRRKINGAVTKI